MTLGWVTIMTAGANDDERCPSWDRLDEAVDAFVRCQATDEQHALAISPWIGCESLDISPTVDDPSA
jgi:hypothetical protein